MASIPQPEIPEIKVYILSVTRAMTRHTTFEVCYNRSYEETKLALQRVFFGRGVAALMISDGEPSFKAVSKDFSTEEQQWMDEFKNSKERHEIEKEWGTTFRFNNPGSPEMQALVERLHSTITHSMLRLKSANLLLSQFTNLVKGLQATLNKRPLTHLGDENADKIEIVTPHMLLTGYDLMVSPHFTVAKNVIQHAIQTRDDIVRYT